MDKANAKILIAMENKTNVEKQPTPQWILRDTNNVGMANLIKDCLLYKNVILKNSPHLPFPQHHCSFSYKLRVDPDKELSLPVGLLYHLWDKADEFRGRCPSCGSDIYGYTFGGMLTVGGIKGICLGCGQDASLWLGGLGTVRNLIHKYLPDTPYIGHTMMFGGAKSSEGLGLKILLMDVRYRNAK
jgi:hypothetical protein